MTISIKSVKLSLPFPPNIVNAYFIDTGKHKILFDTGPKTQDSLNTLKNEITKFGGIDAIVLSHGHLDHSGAAKALSELYNVPIYASFNEKERLSENFPKRLERRVKKTIKALNYFNFNDETAKRELEKVNYYKDLMEPIDFLFNFSTLNDSEITFLELPGHTKGSIGIYLKTLNAVLTGDAFLKDGISAFFDPEKPENAVKLYLDSLDKIVALNPEKIYPGHGKRFENPKTIFAEHKLYIENTSKRIFLAMKNGEKFNDLLPKIYSSNYNALIAMAEIIYSLESANIEILQNLKDLLSE